MEEARLPADWDTTGGMADRSSGARRLPNTVSHRLDIEIPKKGIGLWSQAIPDKDKTDDRGIDRYPDVYVRELNVQARPCACAPGDTTKI